MSYSITAELPAYADKQHLHKLRILVIWKRKKFRYGLSIKIKAEQWNGKEIINHANKQKLNSWLKKELNDCEGRVIDLLRYHPHATAEQMNGIVQNKTIVRSINTVQDLLLLMIDENKHTLSAGRIKHYNTFLHIIDAFKPRWAFSEFNSNGIAAFHQYLVQQNYSINTVWSKFNILKTIRTQAMKRKLLTDDPFALYNSPAYQQQIPVFTTEAELQQLQKIIERLGNAEYAQVGWYYLLSCYAGFRISDLKKFSYEQQVQDGRIILRTQKTGEIVSVKIHSRLARVLEYCQTQRLTVSEAFCNETIKTLAKMAGIHKQLSMHAGRHSFAMLLAEKGTAKEDVMKLLGISNPATINVYFRVSNARLDKVVMEKLG